MSAARESEAASSTSLTGVNAAVPPPQLERQDGSGGAGLFGAQSLARYIALRLLQAVPMLLTVIIIDFVLLDLAPGDMAQVLAGETGAASPEYIEHLRSIYGLDQPAPLRLAHYVAQALSLDLGYSLRYQASIAELIATRMPATLLLAASALAIAITVGVAGGFAAAYRPNGWIDRSVAIMAALGCSTPSFLIGLAFVILFSVELRWLPAGGMESVPPPSSGWGRFGDVLAHLVLPATTLGVFFAAIYSRVTRAAMLEAQKRDYVRTAEAKGVGPLRVAYRHVLRNALLPIVTVVGLQAGSLLGGAVLIETVFSWPGLGRLAFESISQRDFNLLSGVVLTSAIGVLSINFIVDVTYSLLDPRVRLR